MEHAAAELVVPVVGLGQRWSMGENDTKTEEDVME